MEIIQNTLSQDHHSTLNSVVYYFPDREALNHPILIEQIPIIECYSLSIHILIYNSNRIYGGKKRPYCLEFKKILF